MGVIVPQVISEDRASGALIVDGSLRFDSSKSQYLTRTPSSSGNRKTFTWSYWVKRTNLSTDQMSLGTADASGNNGTYVYMISTDVLRIEDYSTSAVWRLDATQVFRDASAWYHILFAVDTTQTTNSNRVKLYINGVQVTAFSTATYPTLNYDCFMNSNTNPTSIGRTGAYNLIYSGFCISNVYFIDGQALDASYFGYTDALTNTWRPKKFKPQATPNNGTTWSSSTTASPGINGSYPISNLFDSSTSTEAITSNASGTGSITFSPTAAIPYTSSVEVYITTGGANVSASLNGGAGVSLSNGSGWNTVTTGSGSISSLVLTRTDGAVAASAIRVDGVILVDGVNDPGGVGRNGFYLPFDGSAPIGQDQSGRGNNWTPVNFGGSNTLEKATGALPILNTDGGGKVARVGVRTDSSASSLVLALPLVGIKSDFSNAVNSGTSNKAVTNNGVSFSSSYSNFYGGSGYFNKSETDFLTVGSASDWVAFNNGSDFTFETWFYPTSTGGGGGTHHCLFETNGGAATAAVGLVIGIDSNGAVRYFLGKGSSPTLYLTTDNGLVSVGVWNHIAVSQQSKIIRIFINGVIRYTYDASSYAFPSSNPAYPLYIGKLTDAYWIADGYIQDYRLYTSAKYTQNFIPASTDPDILPDTPSGVSYTSNLTQITDGAVAFDGSGDWLTLSGSNDFVFGAPSGSSNDFTIEGFFYLNSFSASYYVLGGIWTTGSATEEWLIQIQNNGDMRFLTTVGTSFYSANISAGRWYHFAAVRGSSTITLYVNGVSVGSYTNSNSIGSSSKIVYFGTQNGGTWDWNGFISNAHIVKGTALYTSNFTPPSAPISSVANTKLLCCQSNSNPKLSPVGPNVGLSTSTRFNTNFETIPTTVNGISVTNNGSVSTTSAGTNSFGFTNGANFTGSNSLSVNLGSVPNLTTIDLIFKVNGTDNKYLFGLSNSGLVRRSSSSLAWYNNDTDQIVSSTPDDGVWHHLRVTPTDLYFDGTKIQNTTSLPNIATNSNGYMAIGAYRNDSGTIQYNGAVIFGLVRVMPGVDLGAPTVPITTNGSLSSSETIPTDGVIIRVGNAAATNFNPFTVNINTQRGKQSGWATLNPISSFGSPTISNGNLTFAASGASYQNAPATLFFTTTDKYYWEVTLTKLQSGADNQQFAIGDIPASGAGGFTNSFLMYAYYADATYRYGTSGASPTSLSVTSTTGDVLEFAYDGVSGKVWFGVNGIWFLGGNPATNSNPIYTFASIISRTFSVIHYGTTGISAVNFGQKPFKFPPPAGFQPLALANTPRPTIVRPDQYVGVSTYTGNGATSTAGTLARTVTGLSFKPDLIWVKERTATGTWADHNLTDSVRGTGLALRSNTTDTETNVATGFQQGGIGNGVNNGFTIISGNLGGTNNVNNSGSNYVAWAWKAGGNSNTYNINDVGYATASAAGLTAGSITPTGASVNTKSGFSIISWTATGSVSTLSHGLGAKPKLIINKSRSASDDWAVITDMVSGSLQYLYLNSTQAINNTGWGTSPTSSVMSVYSYSAGQTMISYCWAEIPGFSKFGSHTGTSGQNFISLGFEPELVIIKNSSSSSYPTYTGWAIFDSERTPYNAVSNALFANKSQVENLRGNGGPVTVADFSLDLLSNGFCLRDNGASEINLSGNTYIYAAWAKAPTQNLYGAQANAR